MASGVMTYAYNGAGRRSPRIAFMCSGNPFDRTYSSGIYYYMSKALQEYCGEVLWLGSAKPFAYELGKLVYSATRRILRKNYDFLHALRLARSYAKVFDRRLTQGEFDIVFAPESSAEVAFLETDIPIVYESDTTFSLMVDYYPLYTNLMQTSLRQGNAVEAAAIEKASALVYPTSWAARSAVDDYGASQDSVHIIPFGPNFDKEPLVEEVAGRSVDGTCRLLLVGVDWQRKGGDIAFATLLELEKMGVPAALTVCGCVPPRGIKHPHLTVIPYLDKNDARERDQLADLFREASFFILPSRAECAAIVLCEAAAYGLPALATSTGGIPDIVLDGVNGYVLPNEAEGYDYALIIKEICNDPALYARLCKNTRERFEERLNWKAWSEDIAKVFEKCLAGKG